MTKQYAVYAGQGRFGYDDAKNYPTGWPGAGTGRVALAGTQVHLSDAPTAAENALRLGDSTAGGFYPMPLNWLIVDVDGNGHYDTIQAAINAVDTHRESSSTWIGILIYPGTYTETLSISGSAGYIMLKGFSNQTKVTTTGANTLTIGNGSNNIEINNLTIEGTGGFLSLVIGTCDNVTVKGCILSAAYVSCSITMAVNDEVSFIDTFFSAGYSHVFADSSGAAKATFYNCSFYITGSSVHSLEIRSNMTIELYGCTWWAANACNVGIFHSGEADSTVLISRGSLDNEMDDSPWAGSQESGCTLTLYAINGTGWPTWATWLTTETVSIHELRGENGEYITNVFDGHWTFYEGAGTKNLDIDFTGANPVVTSNTGVLILPADTRAVEFTDTSTSSTSTHWKTAYDERGSQIAGDHLTWDGSELDVGDDWYDSIGDLPTAAVTDNDTTHIPTCNSVYDFCETTQGYYNSGDSPSFAAVTATSFVIGANTLTTSEWSFLDGQDQAVKTTDTPWFNDIVITGNADIADNLEVGTSSGDYARFVGGNTEGIIQSASDSFDFNQNAYYNGSAWVSLDTSKYVAILQASSSDTVSRIDFFSGTKAQPPVFTNAFRFDCLTGELQLLLGWINQDGPTANTFASDINAGAGINVGAATGAGFGDIKSSGPMYSGLNGSANGGFTAYSSAAGVYMSYGRNSILAVGQGAILGSYASFVNLQAAAGQSMMFDAGGDYLFRDVDGGLATKVTIASATGLMTSVGGIRLDSTSYQDHLRIARSGHGFHLTQSGTRALLEAYGSTDEVSFFGVSNVIIYANGNIDAVGTITSGAGANYTETGAAGVNLHGTAQVKKYMIILAAALRRGAAPPDIGTEGTFPTLLFSSNQTEGAYFSIHIPADWATGTDLNVGVYWAPTNGNAGTVAWEFDWEARKHDNNETLGTSTAHVEMDDATQGLDNELLESPYGTISGGSLAVDDTIGIHFYRDHDDAHDNYGADAALLHIEIEYIADKIGGAT